MSALKKYVLLNLTKHLYEINIIVDIERKN